MALLVPNVKSSKSYTMILRHIVTFTLLFLYLSGLLAQRGTIEGLVIDGSGTNPLEYAQIGLYVTSDSSLVDGVISGPDGVFKLEKIRYGSYFMEVSFIGYRTESIGPIFLSQQSNHHIAGR